jgi:hypothetical protein
MKTLIYCSAFVFGMLAISCSKTNEMGTASNTVSLKSALTQGIQNLSTAMTAISTSQGSQVVKGPADLLTKSATISLWDTVSHSILLADIAGVYEYKATTFKRGHMPMMRFFNKTKDSTLMVVRLPEEKVKGSKKLLNYSAGDSMLTNNYQITVSDYQLSSSHSTGTTYQMASAIKISDVDAGQYKIQSSKSKQSGYNLASEYDFPNGYITKCSYTPGDTAVSTYAISKDSKTLYEEKYTAIRTDSLNKHREKEFSLTIGDVVIVRQLGHNQASLDSAKVYVAGVLQLKSKVEIVDNTNDPTGDKADHCITNHKKELKITFDDGTTKTLSELTGTVITDIGTLFTSLREANFGKAIVDYIAWDIYFKKQ